MTSFSPKVFFINSKTAKDRELYGGYKVALFSSHLGDNVYVRLGPVAALPEIEGVQQKLYGSGLPFDDTRNHAVIMVDNIPCRYSEIGYL